MRLGKTVPTIRRARGKEEKAKPPRSVESTVREICKHAEEKTSKDWQPASGSRWPRSRQFKTTFESRAERVLVIQEWKARYAQDKTSREVSEEEIDK